MLHDQSNDGRAERARRRRPRRRSDLAGAPIEGPTHFSQFDPLAVELWGQAWFERGCISSHFRTMVVEGEEVQASATTDRARTGRRSRPTSATARRCSRAASRSGPDHPQTALEARRAAQGDPGELFILDQLEVGMAVARAVRRADPARRVERPGCTRSRSPRRWPGSPSRARGTRPTARRRTRGGRSSCRSRWSSVLANKSGRGFPVRGPVLGLFLDLEVRMVAGPDLRRLRLRAASRRSSGSARAGAPSRTGPRRRSPIR